MTKVNKHLTTTTKKKKPMTYKQLMRQIIKSKNSTQAKDEKTIKKNTGGGKFTQVEKI